MFWLLRTFDKWQMRIILYVSTVHNSVQTVIMVNKQCEHWLVNLSIAGVALNGNVCWVGVQMIMSTRHWKVPGPTL